MATEHDLTKEFGDGIPSADEVAFREHSRPSGAKKTIEVAPNFPADLAQPRTADPIQGALTAVSVTLPLALRTAYRVIASSPLHFRLTNGDVTFATAVTTDIYLPANTALVIKTEDKWKAISAIKAAGAADGIVQATAVR